MDKLTSNIYSYNPILDNLRQLLILNKTCRWCDLLEFKKTSVLSLSADVTAPSRLTEFLLNLYTQY